MGASAYYKISARDETKAGVRSALNNLHGLKTGASSALSGVAKVAGGVGMALAAIGVAGLGINGLKESVQEFHNAEGASIRLAQAVRNNPLIDGSGFARLEQYAKQLQKLTTYDDDQIKGQESILAGMQLSEEQIKATMDAAVNLAASGLMPLDTAVQALGKTWSGNLGTLSRTMPALKNLTKEQLKNGEAVNTVAKNYAGMAEAMAKTQGGIYAQFQNRFGDLKESLGRPLSSIGVGLIDAISPGIDKMTAWLDQNSNKIVNFFTNIPDIAMKALSMIPGILETVFSLDFIKAFFQGLWNYYTQFLPALGKGLWEAFKGWFKAIGSLIAGVSAGLWVPLREKFKDIIDGIKVFFADAINFLIEKVNVFLAGFTKAAEWGPIKKALEALKIEVKPIEIKTIDTDKMRREIAARKAEPTDINAMIEAEREKFYGSALDGLNQTLGAFGDIFASLGDTMSPTMSLIAAKLEPIKAEIAALINATNANTAATTPGDIAAGGTPNAAPSDPSWISKLFDKIGFGQDDFGALKTADGFKGLLTVIQPLTGYLAQFAGPLALLGIVVKGVLDILLPAIQSVLTPLFNALTFIGQMLGRLFLPVLDALAPIISLIAMLLISFMEPIMEAIIPGIEILAAILTILNPVIKAVAVAFEVVSAPIKWIGDLFMWFGEVIKAIAHNIKEYIDHPFKASNRDIWDIPGFSSDAFSGLQDRINRILNAGGTDMSSSGSDWEQQYHDGLATIPGAYGDTSAASGASYTTMGDVYLSIYNYGVIAGDAGLDAFVDTLVGRLEERGFYGKTA